MRTIPLRGLFLACAAGMAAASASAVVDRSLVSEFAVRDMLDEEARATAQGPAPQATRERQRDLAKQRAERIRTLPAERVAEWVQGDRSDQSLELLHAASLATREQPRTGPARAEPVRVIRLSLAAVTALTLAFVLARRRSRDNTRTAKRNRPSR